MIDPDPSVLKPDPSDKRSSCPDVSPRTKQSSPVERFLRKHPDALVFECAEATVGNPGRFGVCAVDLGTGCCVVRTGCQR